MSTDTDPALRASDFRKAWPVAMAVALRECGELAEQIDATNASIQQSKNGIFKLAEMIPKFLTATEQRLDDVVSKFIGEVLENNEIALNAIADKRSDLERLRKQFIVECQVESKKLLDTANRLYRETEALEKAKVAFKSEKTEFESLSFFERLFYK